MVFNFKNIKKKLNKKNIEDSLRNKGYNEFDLLKYYIPEFKRFNHHFKSDIRDDDANNSMICRVNKGKIVISDFGYRTGMNIYDYLIEKYYSNKINAFYWVLDLIRRDFNLDDILPLNDQKIPPKSIPIHFNEEIKDNSLPVKIEVKRRRIEGKNYWRTQDIEYWKLFGISIQTLEKKGIAPLEKFWITNFNKDGYKREYKIDKDLCYVYPFYRNKDGYFMYKIYLPLGYNGNRDFKWISNVNKKVIQNYNHINEKGDLLIIQSSYKDIMTMEELFPELNIISFNGEGMWCEEEEWNELSKRFMHKVIFANNDFTKKNNPGLTMARRHSLLYNIPFVCTPDNTASDISDYYKKYGKEQTKDFLIKTFNNINMILYA